MPQNATPTPAPPPPPTPPSPPVPSSSPAQKKPSTKKKGGWFQKVPREVLISPGGMVLFFLAVLLEATDWLPLPPVLDQIIEIPLEVIFIVLFIIIAKPSIKSMVIPFIIERIPGLSDILPTWVLKFFF